MQWADRSCLLLQEVFHAEGIQNSFTGKTGNTFNSHRLIALAGRQGPEVQNNLMENLFRAYFCEVGLHCWLLAAMYRLPGGLGLTMLHLLQGKFINDPKVLLEAANAAGLADAEKVVADPEAGRQQVCPGTSCSACGPVPEACDASCQRICQHQRPEHATSCGRCWTRWSAAPRSASAARG